MAGKCYGRDIFVSFRILIIVATESAVHRCVRCVMCINIFLFRLAFRNSTARRLFQNCRYIFERNMFRDVDVRAELSSDAVIVEIVIFDFVGDFRFRQIDGRALVVIGFERNFVLAVLFAGPSRRETVIPCFNF